MSKRFDVCSPRAGKEGKTFWHRIGTAFENEKGISIVFDSLPLPDKEGRTSAFLFEPKAKVGAAAKPKAQSAGNGGAEMDDEIPF